MNLLTEFDQEQYDRIRRREGYEDGISQGAQQNAKETAKRMLQGKLSIDEVVQYSGLPLERVMDLQKEI